MGLAKVAMEVMVVLSLCMVGMEAVDDSHTHPIKLRRLQVTVYYHDILNVTDFILVNGPNFRPITPVAASFGTIYFFNDLVTEGPEMSSTPLGNITGSYIMSSPGYGKAAFTPLVLALSNTSSPSNPDLQGLHGTLTMVGIATPDVVQPQPITGGSGSFQCAIGTHTVSPVSISTYTQTLRIDLDLYWPPYTF